MSYINESVSSMSDFITKLNTFLTGTPAWTADHFDTGAGKWAINKGGVYVSFRWDTASPNNLGIYHALGFISTATDPGNHTDDSGSGTISGTDSALDDERYVRISNTPLQYWAFEDDTYVHVVVQRSASPDVFLHIGWGILDKVGDWTGGEYCYGDRIQGSISSNVAILEGTTMLLDGATKSGGAGGQPTNMEKYCATVHTEGLPNMTNKWSIAMGDQSFGDLGIDRGSNSRKLLQGGYRGGPVARAFGRFAADSEKGLMPGYPITVFYRDNVPTTETVEYLGKMKDVRGVSIEHYVSGQEITIGGDVWIIFSSSVKWVSGALTNTTGYQGIMYKKVTT